MVKKLTLTDLMKNKEKYQVIDEATEEVVIERLNATITLKQPERSLCLDTIDLANSEKGKADPFMVYSCCIEPNLKDKELQQAYGCKEPVEIVEKIFKPGEIVQLSEMCLNLAGYGVGVKRVKDLKN